MVTRKMWGRGRRRRKKEGELREEEEGGVDTTLFLADENGWMDGQSFYTSHRRKPPFGRF